MDRDSRRALVEVLKTAYSGERAAAAAYRGHWKSVRDPEERERIRTIEEEERHHRQQVGAMLQKLGERPSRGREARAALIGGALNVFCRVAPWFVPMYGAGRLESHNVKEYEAAARYARDCGCIEFVDCLLTQAEVEWEHEKYFRSKAESHPWSRRFKLWEAPPPKETIRASFAAEGA